MANTFTWTAPSGAKITLPSLSTIPAGVLRRHRKLDEVDFVFTILEDVLDDEGLKALDSLGFGEINGLFEAWQKDAGTTVGESGGSST
jgi:hypothetical protein